MVETPVLRSDNGLVFLSRRFREACTFYRLRQEYITPYTQAERANRALLAEFQGGVRLAADL